MSKIYNNELFWLEEDYGKETIMHRTFDDFWKDLVDYPTKNTVIINGVHYQHNDMNIGTRKEWRGSGGRLFTIKLKDGTIVKTNDLWVQGTIPDQFKDQLPNNAEFV